MGKDLWKLVEKTKSFMMRYTRRKTIEVCRENLGFLATR
jgi:hypothetical protein